MALILTSAEFDDLHEQATTQAAMPNTTKDELETVQRTHSSLGQGDSRSMMLSPGIELSLAKYEYCQDWQLKVPAHDHLIQISLFVSGWMDCSIHPTLGDGRGYFSGSGISPGYVETYQAGQQAKLINIEIDPAALGTALLTPQQRQTAPIRQLFKTDVCKASFYPVITAQMRSLVHQMWHVPYQGTAKRLYLQAKVFELLAIHLDALSNQGATAVANQGVAPAVGLKPDTVERVYAAREILTRQLEHPPSLLALAKQVGVCDRTLRRGFKALYGTTVIGYLTQQRMYQAERLLRSRQCTVTEAARQVGYGHLGHFATKFKRQFGMTPQECLQGKLAR
ncbi:MAG: AraC family transcriptional regulator [Cyanobacteria bacterium J06626_6]